MSGASLLIGMLFATVGWQLVVSMFSEPLAQRIYTTRLEKLKASGLSFTDEASVQTWVEETSISSMHMSLFALAVACGALAGFLNFPLIGFSRSTNGWSWARLAVLCGVSWLVAGIAHPNYW